MKKSLFFILALSLVAPKAMAAFEPGIAVICTYVFGYIGTGYYVYKKGSLFFNQTISHNQQPSKTPVQQPITKNENQQPVQQKREAVGEQVTRSCFDAWFTKNQDNA